MQKDMIKVMSVFGTRPEAIKMAPLVKVLEQTEGIESIVCVTAQHREMLDQVLEIFDLHPKYDLNIMQSRQTLAGITTRALTGLEEVMAEEKPDIVLVHGDTSTTFAGAPVHSNASTSEVNSWPSGEPAKRGPWLEPGQRIVAFGQ